MTTDQSMTEYRESLLLHLRLQDVPGDRIGEIVAEVESHVAETGEDPTEAFGSPKEYAASLTDEHRKPPVWWTAVTVVLAFVAGWCVAQGLFAVLSGEQYAGHSGWLWMATGLVLAVPPGVMVARRSTAVVDPRTGEPMVRTAWWGPVSLIGLPLVIVVLGWIVVELAA
jgi:hypothetical protein